MYLPVTIIYKINLSPRETLSAIPLPGRQDEVPQGTYKKSNQFCAGWILFIKLIVEFFIFFNL